MLTPLACSALTEENGTGVAVEALKDFVLLVAPACSDDVSASAVEAALEVGADEGAAVGCVAGSLTGPAVEFVVRTTGGCCGAGAWHGACQADRGVRLLSLVIPCRDGRGNRICQGGLWRHPPKMSWWRSG